MRDMEPLALVYGVIWLALELTSMAKLNLVPFIQRREPRADKSKYVKSYTNGERFRQEADKVGIGYMDALNESSESSIHSTL